MAVVSAVIGVGGLASAQMGIGSFSSVRGGIFFPSQSGNSTGWALGVDTRILGFGVKGVGLSLEGSADYYQNGGNHNIPILLGLRFTADQTSFAVGAGVGFSHVNGGESADYNMALSVRQMLSKGPLPFFLEGRYYYSTRDAVRGFGVMVGLKF